MSVNGYAGLLARKRQLGGEHGFDPSWGPDFLFPFQARLVQWATRKGRAAIFADCGLGKTPMQLVWAEECGEVARAVHDTDDDKLRAELVQVAAVAVAWLEAL